MLNGMAGVAVEGSESVTGISSISLSSVKPFIDELLTSVVMNNSCNSIGLMYAKV